MIMRCQKTEESRNNINRLDSGLMVKWQYEVSPD